MKRLAVPALALIALAPLSAQPVGPRPVPEARLFTHERDRLIASIGDYAQPIGESGDPRILEAMRALPRHLFVPSGRQAASYQNQALPIDEGQTISQPSLVALMTHLLRPKKTDVVLEVGTGSGYQAALLSRLVARVYTIEILAPLARQAGALLARLGHSNVEVRHGDGYAGWPERGPFDSIIVTAGAPHIPQPLVDQLKPGGRMVIPVGPVDAGQQLMLVTRNKAAR